MPRLSVDDEKTMRDKALLREILAARPQILARLQDLGLSDLRDVDIMTMCTLDGYFGMQVVVDLAVDLGISGQELASAASLLTASGCLEMRANPGAPGRQAIKPSPKGRAAARIIMETIKIKRWASVRFRPGDIVICSVPKSGTTWLQMICALLIFQTPELPAPLQELSIWVDSDNSQQDVFTRLEAQPHRRFMKTHRRLSEIPLDPRVTYVVIARRPLDMALSYYHHLRAKLEGNLPPGISFPSVTEVLRLWMDGTTAPDGIPVDFLMSFMMAHLCDSWAHRDEPNVILLHYDDLLTDLAGQMRALAARIGVTVPEATWPRLVRAATFHEMRTKADRIQPLPSLRDPTEFFRSGTSGGGRQHISGSEFTHYHELAARLARPDLLAWVNREDRADDASA